MHSTNWLFSRRQDYARRPTPWGASACLRIAPSSKISDPWSESVKYKQRCASRGKKTWVKNRGAPIQNFPKRIQLLSAFLSGAADTSTGLSTSHISRSCQQVFAYCTTITGTSESVVLLRHSCLEQDLFVCVSDPTKAHQSELMIWLTSHILGAHNPCVHHSTFCWNLQKSLLAHGLVHGHWWSSVSPQKSNLDLTLSSDVWIARE